MNNDDEDDESEDVEPTYKSEDKEGRFKRVFIIDLELGEKGRFKRGFINTIFLIIIVTELGQSLADFGKSIKLLGAYERDALGTAFSELGAKSEMLPIKLQRERTSAMYVLCNLSRGP